MGLWIGQLHPSNRVTTLRISPDWPSKRPPFAHHHAQGWGKGHCPLAPMTAEVVDDYVAAARRARCSRPPRGDAGIAQRLGGLSERLAGEAIPAKPNSIHPHDLRHAFVTLKSSIPEPVFAYVQDAAGHPAPRTTRRSRQRHVTTPRSAPGLRAGPG